MTRIAYAGGGWATNIGNAFYNLGTHHLLERVAGAGPVWFVPDVASWTWTTDRACDVLVDVDADLWVLSGPSWSRGIVGYRPLLDRIARRGAHIAFVSVGLWDYTPGEWQTVRAVLEPHLDRIAFVSTRDRRTYERALELGVPCHDGVCGSMFLPEALPVAPLDRPPYVVVNLGADDEPTLSWDGGEVAVGPPPPRPRHRLVPPAVATSRVGRSRLGRRVLPTPPPPQWHRQIGPYDIVRTRSGRFDAAADTVFDRPDTFYADLPQGYAALYAAAELVITDRVHTTAATLVLGGRARYLFSGDRARDGRWSLLERVGAGDVVERPVRLDADRVGEDKATMAAWLVEELG